MMVTLGKADLTYLLNRWGKNYEDKRNWKEYNEKLVKRGELYLSLKFLERFVAFAISIFHMPYRQMERFIQQSINQK